jgi:hypothetical protein
MNAKKRLEALEGGRVPPGEDLKAAAKRLADIRAWALHTNRCQDRYEEPLLDLKNILPPIAGTVA